MVAEGKMTVMLSLGPSTTTLKTPTIPVAATLTVTRVDIIVNSRVEIIWGIAPVRPGPSYGYLSPSRSGPETGFVAIVLVLSLSYCLSNNELRRLASYYATSNFYVHEFSAFAPYVTHTTINERTHTSLYLCA